MPFIKTLRQLSSAAARLAEMKRMAKLAEEGKLPNPNAPDQLLTKEQRAAQSAVEPHKAELEAIKNVRQEVADSLKSGMAPTVEKADAVERLSNLYNSLNLEDILQKLPKDSTEAGAISTLLLQRDKLQKAIRQGATSRELHEIGKETFPIFQSINIDRLNKELGSKNKLSKTQVAGLAAIGVGASALSPDEAEAGFPGSAAANKKISELMDRALENWIVYQRQKARETLQKQFELDPTGAAQKEALRRLSARTDVRKNPVTGEHEFKLYRGDTENRFSGSPQSFTTDPNIAGEFAELYGGKVNEVWVPASSIGSIPGLLKQGKYLSSEKEVITKPFKAQSTPYVPKEPTLHERISKRGAKKLEEETDDYISEMLSEGSGKKAAGLAAAGVGASALSSKEAKADEPTSSAEDESTPTSPALGGPELRGEKSGLSEEEYEKRKAAIQDKLEKLGVFGRHMWESGTAGLTEHAIARPLAGWINMIATAGKDNPLTWDERYMQGMREDQEYYKKAKERQLGTTAAADIAGLFVPVKAGGVVNAGFSAAHKAAEALPLLNKARQAKGLIGAGANIATHAGAGAAGMALADKAEKVINKAGSAISGLPEEKHEGSTWEAAKEGAKIGAGFEAIGQVGRAVGGPKVGAALQAASALGLLGTGAYEAVKSSEEEKSQAPLTDEEREFFRRNAHLFLDDSTRHPAYQRRRVKNSTDITDSE